MGGEGGHPGFRPSLPPIQFVQQLQPPLPLSSFGAGAEAGFGVELGQGDGREFLEQFVQANPPCARPAP